MVKHNLRNDVQIYNRHKASSCLGVGSLVESVSR